MVVAVFGFRVLTSFVSAIFTFVYWLNRVAVRTDLEPRRAELERLLVSLNDEEAEVR